MKTTYFLIISLTTFTLTYFLGDKVLIPFDEHGDLVAVNFAIMGIFSNIALISLFAYFHSSIDKLIRNEKMSISLAVRRGLLLALHIDFLIYIRITGLWSILNVALSIGIAIMIEMFFSMSTTEKLAKGQKAVL